MWSSGRRVLQELLLLRPATVRSFSRTPAQCTVIVERWWQVPLSKEGSPPRLHLRRHRVFKLVEDTKHLPKEKLELILTQTVPRVGGRGETVLVTKSVGRNKLLAKGLAVYATPENKEIYEEEIRLRLEGKGEGGQTHTGELTVKFLQRSTLKINRIPSDDFQLTKELICRQFLKKLGVIVPPHALSFPFESVKDVGEYWCDVTVNGLDTVRIPLLVTPYVDPSAKAKKEKRALRKQLAVEALSNPSATEDAAVQMVSDATVEAAEAAKDSVNEVSETSASSSAAEETAASEQISQDSTAPPSDKPKTE